MLMTPACENCVHFDYDGCKCEKYPDGVPDEIFFISIEGLKKKCDQFVEESADVKD